MIQSLRIRNLALLDEVALDFEEGFTVVTGETGAGKSILLGALSLLAGERADKTLIRQGAAACEIEASLYFPDSSEIDRVLRRLELPSCEEGQLIVKRSVPREKAPKITVNGSLATLSALQALGECWIDFHGPSEPRRLLKESCQLELLDLFARNSELLKSYSDCYSALHELCAEKERLLSEEHLSAEQLLFMEAQVKRLDSLNLESESIEALERDFTRLSKAQDIIDASSSIAGALSGEDGLEARLAAVLRQARTLEGIEDSCATLASRLSSLSIELSDLSSEYEKLAQECQFDPEEAESLRQRMEAWLEAKRRHGGDLAVVRAARDSMHHRLEVQSDIEGACAKLDARIEEARSSLRRSAGGLRTSREKAAKELAKSAAKGISQLGFKRADFLVHLETLSDFGPSGDCRCEFLFSPNVGEAPLPLGKIASSGELARVMLALKTVLADLDHIPVLVFDEVDANVGGEIGSVVGDKMAQLAKRHQVFCVTHLPQVAAKGVRHLLVEKDQSGTRAEVKISDLSLSRKARVSELARMLGDRNARSAQAHAEELLG
jgi:DNA repair protein RecN (Recombination protein N)